MDWKKTFNKGQWFTHGAFLLAALLATLVTIFALRLNHLHSTEEERSLKLNSLIEHLKKDQSFDKIGKYLSWAESDKAHDKIRDLSQKIAVTEELLEIRASEALNDGIKKFNKLISDSSAFSNPEDALKLLRQKISNLLDLARSRNYKNLTQMAEKLKNRTEQLNGKNVGDSSQVGQIKVDLKRMEQMVAASALSEAEKNQLSLRFSSMNHEIELLSNINMQSKELKTHTIEASLALSQWVLDLEKHSGDLQGMRMEKQRQLILLLSGLAAFILLCWVAVAYIFRWQQVKMAVQIELEVKNVIEKGIINDQRFMLDQYSESMRNEIIRLLDDLKLKLGLGAMLHEGLPFAGCMVDKNFKLTWFNHLFLEQLYLSEEEVRSDAFNWDYVRDYLNLNDDPIYQALIGKIAGIYPVKVKQDELTPAQPYEMYVTPISVNREDRVMVFFYPLVAIKDAINEQVALTREPIERFILLWEEERLSADELKLLAHDFKNNDLPDLYRIFTDLYHRMENEKQECYSTISALEKENYHFKRTLAQLAAKAEIKQDLVRQEFKLTRELRHSFVKNIEKSETLIQINKTIMQYNDDLRGEAQKLHHLAISFMKKNKETAEIIGQLEGVRVDYKKLKMELQEVKAKLISMNNSLFGQLPVLDEHQQKMATRYKDELARLDFNVCTLDKKLSQLDVLLGKLQMMHDRGMSAEQTHFNFLTSQKDHELRENLLETQKSLSSEEVRIIENFKTLHALMKQDMNVVQETKMLSFESQNSCLS